MDIFTTIEMFTRKIIFAKKKTWKNNGSAIARYLLHIQKETIGKCENVEIYFFLQFKKKYYKSR